MVSFSDIIKNHAELKDTIAQIEATKKRIKTNEKEVNPSDQEFQLRTHEIAVGPSQFGTGAELTDQLPKPDNLVNIDTIFRIFASGIKSGELTPFNAYEAYRIIEKGITVTSSSISDSKKQIGSLLAGLQSKRKFSQTDIRLILQYLEILDNSITSFVEPRQNLSNVMSTVSGVAGTVASAVGPTVTNLASGASRVVGETASATGPLVVSFSIRQMINLVSIYIRFLGAAVYVTGDLVGAIPAAARSMIPSSALPAGVPALPAPESPPASPRPATPPVLARPSAPVTPVPFTPAPAAGAAEEVDDELLAGMAALTPSPPPETTPPSPAQAISMARGHWLSKEQADDHLKNKQYTKEEMARSLFKIVRLELNKANYLKEAFPSSNERTIAKDYLIFIYMFGRAKGKTDKFLDGMLDLTNNSLSGVIKTKINILKSAQDATGVIQNKFSKDFMKEVYNNDSSKVLDAIFPESRMGAAGRGLKKGKGLKSIKAVENRANDLMSAAQGGNKSIELRNELDTHLSTLIDKKKMKASDRDKIMQSIYGRNK